MVLVAAPGGGAKAAYWTAGGMDRLFGADGACPLSLFAASGVSGGALGLTTRLAIAPTSPTDPLPALEPDAPSPLLSQPVVEELIGEDPLARTISAMLLRDLPQPFTAIRSAWRDRAAVMEDAWAAATDVFTVYDPVSGAGDHRGAEKADGRDVTLLDLGVGWWPAGAPILVLNGTSVTDGCRALVANVRLLPVRSDSCLDVPGSGEWRSGSVSAAVAPLKGLRPATGYDGGADGDQPNSLCPDPKDTVQTVRATTAALLAARFPYVTPSGALRRCASNEVRTTYVVDGGYVENTGLLTLLQMWSKIERRVTVCNAWAQQQTHPGRRGEGSKIRLPSQCPRTSDGTALLIEPWVVLLENHYRSVTTHEHAKRPREVFVPPATALGKQRTTTSTVSLEQAALSEMRGDVATRRGSTCSRFMRLAPNVKVEVQAPLGWVLSSGTRATMTTSLKASWSQLNGSTNPCVTWNSP